MLVTYHVETETASFYFYTGEHSEKEITEFNRKISDFIRELITNGKRI